MDLSAFAALPLDLAQVIVEAGAYIDMRTAANLSKTCRLAHLWCTPILYQVVHLETLASLQAFLATISSTPGLAWHLRRLSTVADPSFSPQGLRNCVNLSTLAVFRFHWGLGKLYLPPSITKLACDAGYFTTTLPPYRANHEVFKNISHLHLMSMFSKAQLWRWLGQAFLPALRYLTMEHHEDGTLIDAARHLDPLIRQQLPPQIVLCVVLLFTASNRESTGLMDEVAMRLMDGRMDPRVVVATQPMNDIGPNCTVVRVTSAQTRSFWTSWAHHDHAGEQLWTLAAQIASRRPKWKG
ncbi:hypothetical protein DL96DRAFT_931623 [Flagelloscypha sp. PMI_526]|nr:hypothetical protein DL96DRAFT_931623 [Flagelloscypha sp. PMI_526]